MKKDMCAHADAALVMHLKVAVALMMLVAVGHIWGQLTVMDEVCAWCSLSVPWILPPTIDSCHG
jgi:hypothetical protein